MKNALLRKTALEAWFQEAVAARGQEQQDINHRYPSTNILPGNRVVFNIKGNTYRLIVNIHYNAGIIFIRRGSPCKDLQ